MKNQALVVENLFIKPIDIKLYVPPIIWKGDSAGHIGINDIFFFVLEGECFLNVDSQSHIVRPGQLAYLPKGKMRAYTHVSERFSMYEMAFEAKVNGENLMSTLGLDEYNFVVDVPNTKEMTTLFENSSRKELNKNPIYDVGWCANIINIIKIYAEERSRQTDKDGLLFKPVLEYIHQNIDKNITIENLSSAAYIQPTYFIKKFKNSFGLPPIAYLNRERVFKAMGLLAKTELSISQISTSVGISDVSYFARMFKKHCKVTPSEYRAEFKKI